EPVRRVGTGRRSGDPARGGAGGPTPQGMDVVARWAAAGAGGRPAVAPLPAWGTAYRAPYTTRHGQLPVGHRELSCAASAAPAHLHRPALPALWESPACAWPQVWQSWGALPSSCHLSSSWRSEERRVGEGGYS